jgi:hypothetical protein
VLNRTPRSGTTWLVFAKLLRTLSMWSMHSGRLLDRREALAPFYALAALRLMKCITSNITPTIRAM